MKGYFVLFILWIFLFSIMGNVSAGIRIDSISYDPNYIEPGNEVTIYAKFHNSPVSRTAKSPPSTEDGLAKPIMDDSTIFYKTILEPASDLSERYVIIEDSKKNVGHLFTGETWTTPFDIKISESAITANYRMRFSVIQTDEEGSYEEIARTYEFEIPVKSSVVFDVDSENRLRLGTTGNIVINISNRGGDARDVVVELTLNTPFTPATTSSKYVGDLEGDETRSVEFSVAVDSDAEPKTYSIPVMITYIDDNGNSVSVEKDIGVKVEAEPDIGVALDESDRFTRGIKGKVTINFINEGFVDAKFLKVRLLPSDDYEILSTGESYIGNLDSDDSETETFEIRINRNTSIGRIPLEIELSYKSSSSDLTITKREKIYITVLSETEYADEQQSGMDIISFIMGMVVFIPVIIVIYIVLWFVYKVVGLFTGYLNKRLFNKR